MAVGSPVTPEQTATILEAWLETANKSEAARRAGVAESTARAVIAKHRAASRCELHARACERAEREARSYVQQSNDHLRVLLTKLVESGESASDVAQIARALNDGARVIVSMSDATARRAKITAEADAIARGESAGGVTLVVPQVLVDAPDEAPAANRPPDE